MQKQWLLPAALAEDVAGTGVEAEAAAAEAVVGAGAETTSAAAPEGAEAGVLWQGLWLQL